jgi:excisionase family DNA binding protein
MAEPVKAATWAPGNFLNPTAQPASHRYPMRLEVTTLERRAISITQACESVGVSRRTIYNWMAAGKVQYVRTAGGAVRIFEDTLWRAPQVSDGLSAVSAEDQQA